MKLRQKLNNAPNLQYPAPQENPVGLGILNFSLNHPQQVYFPFS